MSLWGKTENVVIPGTYAGASGNNQITASGVSDISEIISVGDKLYLAEGGNEAIVVSAVVNATRFDIANNLTAALSGSLFKRSNPKWVKDPEYAENLSIVSTEDASSSDFKEVGLDTPGWVYSRTYEDQNGKTRNKTETLVVFKS